MLVNERVEQERKDLAAVMDAWERNIGLEVQVTPRGAYARADHDLRAATAKAAHVGRVSVGALHGLLVRSQYQPVGGRVFRRLLRTCQRPPLFWLERGGDGPWNNWGY